MGCGDQTFGTDFIDLYPQRRDVVKCNVEAEPFPFADGSFDEVYSENMLEHLKNPNLVLREMVRVLKPGGQLTVITDNASFWAFHFGAKTHYGGYEERSVGGTDDRHYALYTSWHLQNHFSSLQLTNIRTEYLFVEHKHSRRWPVKMITGLLSWVAPHLANPQVKISGIKS